MVLYSNNYFNLCYNPFSQCKNALIITFIYLNEIIEIYDVKNLLRISKKKISLKYLNKIIKFT